MPAAAAHVVLPRSRCWSGKMGGRKAQPLACKLLA
jgi:hypothetical protein